MSPLSYHYQRKAVEFLQKKYGERTDEFLTAFEKATPGYQPKDLVDVDFVFRPGAVEQAKLKLRSRVAPVYVCNIVSRGESPVLDGTVSQHALHGHSLCLQQCSAPRFHDRGWR